MTASVTVLVTQRERFSGTGQSLDALYSSTQVPFELIAVDGGSPVATQALLARQAEERGFTVIRRDGYLTQNEARNLAWPLVTTPYVCCVDNDVVPFAGWLEALLACAEETGADVVGPLYAIHTAREGHRVHTTEGSYRVIDRGRHQAYAYRLLGEGVALDDPAARGERRPVEQVEFHCMLLRTDVVRAMGGFDEGYRSSLDHVDVCLTVAALGGSIWSEPAAVVSYLQPPPFERSDLPFFMLRWSEAWERASTRHFEQKWGPRAGYDHRTWIRKHRSLAYHAVPDMAIRLLGERLATAALGVSVFQAEGLINRVVARSVARRHRRA